MRLRTLNALIARASVDPFAYGGRGQWETITPTTITRHGDRGQVDVETFRDEDELCRHLLVRTLAPLPPRPGARRHASSVRALPAGAVSALSMRWRLVLPPGTDVVGRGRGLVVLRDTSGLVADPEHGAPQVTVVDVASGDVRASWLPPHDIGSAVVVGDADEPVVVLSGSDGRTEAFSVDGERWWSFLRPLWAPAFDAGGVIVLQDASLRAGGTTRAGDAVGLDVRSGRQVWACAALSRPVFAFGGVPRLDRFFAWQAHGDHLTVLRIDLATGDRRAIAGGTLPPPVVEAELTVLEDLMDADCSAGHLTIRTSASHPAGVGTQLSDVVVVAGDARLRVPTEEGLLSWSCAPGRLVRGVQEVRCEDLDGNAVWVRPERGVVRARAADVVLLETRGVVEAVADDGATRWERRGVLGVVTGDAVWVHDGSDLDVLDAATGHVRWTGPAPWGAGRSEGSTHCDDDVVLVRDDAELQAFGAEDA